MMVGHDGPEGDYGRKVGDRLRAIRRQKRMSLQEVEATSNQVNQEGGYTGRTPRDFVGTLVDAAGAAGLPADRVLFGGDHLGPHPWQGEPAERAMAKARCSPPSVPQGASCSVQSGVTRMTENGSRSPSYARPRISV